MDGEVLWSGVVDLDADSATVIAATTGTVANEATGRQAGRPRPSGSSSTWSSRTAQWKTSNLECVG